MPLQITIEPAARQDIAVEFGYLTERNANAAVDYYDSVYATFDRLAEMPGIGTLIETNKPSLAGVRRFPVPGFPKYLIYYRATEAELHIVRVLHGARDISNILESN